MKRFSFLIVVIALLLGTACAQTKTDMVTWWTTQTPGHYLAPANGGNPLYSAVWPGKFWLVKGSTGYPWDINLYDDNYVYLWITEWYWSNSTTFKKFNDGSGTALSDKSMPVTPRFLAIPNTPGKIASIKVSNSRFEFDHCDTAVKTSTLGHVVNEVWGPYQESIPFTDQNGVLHSTLRTLVVSYRYNCDTTYNNCQDKEDFHLAKPYGLVKWDHYQLVNGSYVIQNMTTHNALLSGTVVPVFPCF